MSRSGFVALAGRPNVGKSTFVNAVVGEKIAIVSDRPQTTRRAIRGVHQSGDCQLVLVDLPGVQRPRDALTTRMARRVREEMAGADAVLLMLNAQQGIGPGDRFIAQTLLTAGRPVTIAVNKVDKLARAAADGGAPGGGRAGAGGRGLPALRTQWGGHGGADRAPRRADAGGAVHVRSR